MKKFFLISMMALFMSLTSMAAARLATYGDDWDTWHYEWNGDKIARIYRLNGDGSLDREWVFAYDGNNITVTGKNAYNMTLNAQGLVETFEKVDDGATYTYTYDENGYMTEAKKNGEVCSEMTIENENMTQWTRFESGDWQKKDQTFGSDINVAGIHTVYSEKAGASRWLVETGLFGKGSKDLCLTSKWQHSDKSAEYTYEFDADGNVVTEIKNYGGEIEKFFFTYSVEDEPVVNPDVTVAYNKLDSFADDWDKWYYEWNDDELARIYRLNGDGSLDREWVFAREGANITVTGKNAYNMTLNAQGLVESFEKVDDGDTFTYTYDENGYMTEAKKNGEVCSEMTIENENMTQWTRFEGGDWQKKDQTYGSDINVAGIHTVYSEKAGASRWLVETGLFGKGSKDLCLTSKWQHSDKSAEYTYEFDADGRVVTEIKNYGGEIEKFFFAYPTSTEVAPIWSADDNAPVEYFNLQGMRVANPENGLFIRRQGNKVTKVIVR